MSSRRMPQSGSDPDGTARRWRAARSWRRFLDPAYDDRAGDQHAKRGDEERPGAFLGNERQQHPQQGEAEHAGQRQHPGAAATGEAARAPPKPAKVQRAGGDPGEDMQRERQNRRPSRQAVEGWKRHALFIHFQADQQPRANPSISSGAVQNRPEWRLRSSQRPVNMPMSIGTTMIHPSSLSELAVLRMNMSPTATGGFSCCAEPRSIERNL